ncbi:MAG: dienelactone hydrolase family protein [Candidatus Nanohaloarchaeota archaeon QJJ-5]|nr:dienelactone hydrolase family protein [Candidatus Nanohaloarchaeota archaeon QJJ-5]
MTDYKHANSPIIRDEIGDPDKAIILLHGRGATARGMYDLAAAVADDAVVLAPQAVNRTWYPESFMEPIEANQPWLDGSLQKVDDCLTMASNAGFEPDEVSVLGFSQGACLATEWAAQNDPGIHLVAGLSGGLIGAEIDRSRYASSFDDLAVFLGCSDTDPHIPVERVHGTAAVFEEGGVDVETRIYEGMGHTINDDERQFLRTLFTGEEPASVF